MQRGYGRYARFGHRIVNGWLEAQVLPVLKGLSVEQERAGCTGGIAEIGVHQGKLFVALHLARRDGERSLAIDVFEDQSLNTDQSGSGDKAKFLRNLRLHAGGAEDVEIVEADSFTIDGDKVKQLLGSEVRLFSVDGGHTAEIVAHDMQTAADALSPGGVIIADDVFNPSWPGVQEGTGDYLRSDPRAVPFAIGFNKTYFTTPESADRYRELCAQVAARRRWMRKESTMYGHRVVTFGSRPPARMPRRAVGQMLRTAGLRRRR